ncbi:hypothetical protein NDU88_002588 [Pleurodeles waltl]|uniref:Uncharacterized protein n=1 Tax=Pleurodeles waltl TaxID=8319 RepID=A0AAV7UBY0_PLEWA|nr:hypothetical protein NDU88_002588 [Pleurodeles waltl]
MRNGSEDRCWFEAPVALYQDVVVEAVVETPSMESVVAREAECWIKAGEHRYRIQSETGRGLLVVEIRIWRWRTWAALSENGDPWLDAVEQAEVTPCPRLAQKVRISLRAPEGTQLKRGQTLRRVVRTGTAGGDSRRAATVEPEVDGGTRQWLTKIARADNGDLDGAARPVEMQLRCAGGDAPRYGADGLGCDRRQR